MKRPRGIGTRLTPTNMTIILFFFCASVHNFFFYMEMYTYTTNNWLAFDLTKKGVDAVYSEIPRGGGGGGGAVRERGVTEGTGNSVLN